MVRSRKLTESRLRALGPGLSALGETYFWLMYRMDLQRAFAPVPTGVPITITLTDQTEVSELAALTPDEECEDLFRERMRAGSLCFAARVDGRIVAYNWLCLWTAVGAGDVPMLLADDEVYTADAHTADAWRGKGIHPALNRAMLVHAQEMGFKTAYTLVRDDNAASLVTMRRVGWTLSGTLLVFEPRWTPDRLRWLVSGSAYPMPVGRLASLHVRTLADLHAQRAFEGQELIQALPGSHRYRVRRGDEPFELTMVPSEHAAGVRVAAAVARAFPEQVPSVVDCNFASESWMLTREPSAARLNDQSPLPMLTAMLQTYATMQGRAAGDQGLLNKLPPARLDGLVPQVLEFLARKGKYVAATGECAGLAFFLGVQQAKRYRDGLSRSVDMLERHLEPARRLPLTLNCGRLEPGNAVVAEDGSCMLVDWLDAVSGPAGLSLQAMVGNCLPPTVMQPGGADSPSASDGTHPLLAHYLQALASAGYADEQVLRDGLPAAITAGLLIEVLRLARYPMEDAAQRKVVADRLLDRLDRLLALCAHLATAHPA